MEVLICALFPIVALMWVVSHARRDLPPSGAESVESRVVQRRTRMPSGRTAGSRRQAVAAGGAAMTALPTGCSTPAAIPPPTTVDGLDWKNFSGESRSLLMSAHRVSIARPPHLPES